MGNVQSTIKSAFRKRQTMEKLAEASSDIPTQKGDYESISTGNDGTPTSRDGDRGVIWLTLGMKPTAVFELLDSGGWTYSTDREEAYKCTGYPPNYDRYTHDRWLAFINVDYCDVATMERIKALDEVWSAFFERDRPRWAKLKKNKLRMTPGDEEVVAGDEI